MYSMIAMLSQPNGKLKKNALGTQRDCEKFANWNMQTREILRVGLINIICVFLCNFYQRCAFWWFVIIATIATMHLIDSFSALWRKCKPQAHTLLSVPTNASQSINYCYHLNNWWIHEILLSNKEISIHLDSEK